MASSSGSSSMSNGEKSSVDAEAGGPGGSKEKEKEVAAGAADGEEKPFEIFINRNWQADLLTGLHAKYCRKLLICLPEAYEEYDTQRMTLLHFSITTLDLLKYVDSMPDVERDKIANWIYSLQTNYDSGAKCGFQGSSTFIDVDHSDSDSGSENQNEFSAVLYSSHITMTYTALVSLLTIGDDLSRINRKGILNGVSSLQNDDGSFKASIGTSESDMRFVYCAICVCYILNDFSLINVPKVVQYIRKSFSYEGSFGSGFGTEGHAAYTFCAVATLVLLDKLDSMTEIELNKLRKWCLFRQRMGFTGRPNKDEDTCYSYWVGATLEMLGSYDFSNRENNISYLLGNQNPLIGGIGKCDSEYPDPLHTFLGIAGLSLANYKELNQINTSLTMSQNAVTKLKTIHKKWSLLNDIS